MITTLATSLYCMKLLDESSAENGLDGRAVGLMLTKCTPLMCDDTTNWLDTMAGWHYIYATIIFNDIICMMPRAPDERLSISQNDHLRSISPTTGKSDIPPIKGKKIKNNTTSIKKINIGSKPPKPKKSSECESMIQQGDVLSDRYHYEVKQNSIIEETKRKRRKSALALIQGNATQKERIAPFSNFEDKPQGKSANLRLFKTLTNSNKLKPKHFLSIHNQSIKSTPRTYLDSRVAKKGQKKGRSRLKETSIENLRSLITKMIEEELNKKLTKNLKHLSSSKVIEKRKVRKPEDKRKVPQVLILKIKDLKTMTNSLIPSSDTVEDSYNETQRKLPPQRNINLQTTQSLAVLKQLVSINYQEEPNEQESGSIQDIMVSRIKKAWKNYRTQRIIHQYASLFEEEEEGQNPFQQDGELLTDERPSLNGSYSNHFNRRQHLQDRLHFKNSPPDHRDGNLERPNNIPSKRKQIKNLKDALQFIRQEISIQSPGAILQNLMNSIQEEIDGQGNHIDSNQSPNTDEKKKKQLLSLFEYGLVEPEEKGSELENAQQWEFLPSDMDLNLISDGFQKRQRSLIARKQKELRALYVKLKQGKLSQQQYKQQSARVQSWTHHQLLAINRVKKALQKGLAEAQSILTKNRQQSVFEKLHRNKLKKCLSSQDIYRLKISNLLQPHRDEQLNNSAELKRLRKQLDTANNKQKSFPSDEQFFSQQLKFIQEHKSESSEQPLPKGDFERRLKSLDIDDKDDIFEFAFLDLCIQFCQEIYCQQENMKIAIDFITKSRKKPKRKNKGIKTNINTVKEYLKQLKAYLQRTNRDVFEKIKEPLGPTAKQMLKYMHYSEQQYREKDEYDIGSTLILGTSVFQNFENNILPGIQIEPYYTDETKEKNRVKFLKDVIHIHNKAVFDCLNESLDMERPFGMWGAPFPWKTISKFLPELTIQDLEEKYAKAEQKVIQCCSYYCGLLADKEDSLVAPGSKISEQYLQQVKQDRLSRMLAADLLQGQQRWLFYDDEQTQALVQISQIVYEIVMRQAVQELGRVFSPFQML